MEFPIINSRADLDAIYGTPEHVAFMRMLRASIWRIEKDDEAKAWKPVVDTSTIERFGFGVSDFPGEHAPVTPAWANADSGAAIREQIAKLEAAVTPRRMREAVLGADDGWLAGVDAQIAALRSQL